MMIDYNKLFQQHSAPLTPSSRSTVEIQKNVARQFSSLSYEMNKRARVSQKLVTMIGPDTVIMDEKTKSVSWKSLDMCEKYKLLKVFLEGNNIENNEADEFVKALKKGTLEVEYDKSNKSVTKASLPLAKMPIASYG